MNATKSLAGIALAAAVVVAPLSSAAAHPWHGGPFFPFFLVGAAVATGVAAVVSAPFLALGAAVPGPYYGPPPPAYGPGPGYYAPGYYGPPPGYYGPGPYYGR